VRSAANIDREERYAGQKAMIWTASFDAPVNHAVALRSGTAFACGDGTIQRVAEDKSHRAIKVHGGAILSAAGMPQGGLLTAGDDGRLVLSDSDGAAQLISDHQGLWIDCAAASASGAMAWSAGRRVYHRDARGAVRSLDCPSTPADLAFDPKGRRVAIALYGGVWLWLPKEKDNLAPKLDWKGSHLRVTSSPDGRHVLTAMQEHEIHGWRLSDMAHMRMAGYPGKTYSFSWHRSGKLLATSGGPTAIVWPFDDTGPWNRKPAELGFAAAGFAMLAWHPDADVLAAGCSGGGVQLATSWEPGGVEIRAPADGAVTGLCWIGNGAAMAVGTSRGKAEIHAFARN